MAGTEYKGDKVVLEFGGTDLSASARTVTISEAPGEPEKLDVTVKGDTAREFIEGFPGGHNTTVTLAALALDGTDDTIQVLAVNTTGDLEVWPEGDVQSSIEVAISAMRLIGKDYTVPYDNAVEWALTFNSVTAATYTTHQTV